MKPGNIEAAIRRALRAGPLSAVQLAARFGYSRWMMHYRLRFMPDVEPVENPEDRRSVYWRLKA